MAEILQFKKRETPKVEKPEVERWAALDVLRGLCVIGMILVAYAGDWGHRFTVLNHADWHGLALADMIFPGFLFCVGMGLFLSLGRRTGSKRMLATHIVIRGAALFALGLFLNLLPGFDFAHVRIMGILQRIGLAYGVVGLFCVAVGGRRQSDFVLKLWPPILAVLVLVAGYASLLRGVPMPDCGAGCFDSSHSLPTVIDRAVFGVNHLWEWGLTDGVVTFDPEGLLSTLGALINVLMGVIVAQFVSEKGLKPALWPLVFAGIALIVTGAGLDSTVPIIKKIWTPSFALFSAGFSILLYCVLSLLIDVMKLRAWSWPARVLGANATLAFVGISLLNIVMWWATPQGTPNPHAVLASALGAAIPEARIASVAYSIVLVVVLVLALWPLYSRRIFVKL